MNKVLTLEAIKKAKLYHEFQMCKIKALISGEDVEDPTSVSKIKCDFGKWLYEEDNRLQTIFGALFYKNIEELHSRWHLEYTRVFEIFFNDRKKGFFLKIMSFNKVDEMELDKAKLYHSELSQTTNKLLKALELAQRRVLALSDSKFT